MPKVLFGIPVAAARVSFNRGLRSRARTGHVVRAAAEVKAESLNELEGRVLPS